MLTRARLQVAMAAIAAATAAVIVAGFALPAYASAGAQPAEPGDMSWIFRPRGPLADERIAEGIAYLVNGTSVVASAGVDREAQLTYFGLEPAPTRDDARERGMELLAAAGVVEDAGRPFSVSRTCTIWTPAGDDEERRAVASALGAELSRVFGSLGISIGPCQLVGESTDADIFLWEFGQDTHAEFTAPEPKRPSFLGLPDGPDEEPRDSATLTTSPEATSATAAPSSDDGDDDADAPDGTWAVIVLVALVVAGSGAILLYRNRRSF